MRYKLTTTLPVATGVVGITLLYGRLLVPGRALADRDISGLHLPMLADFARLVREGIPYWNPWIHGGQPLLANPHYAAFYPPTWLTLKLPAYYTIGLLIVLHAVWAFVGATRLAARWGCGAPAASLAGLAFIGGGAFATSANMLNLYMGLAWLPWVLAWGDESMRADSTRTWTRAGTKTALALAAQFLIGSPIMPWLSVLALACLSLEFLPANWRRISRLVPVGLTGLGLAAVQILPAYRHLADSVRGEGLATTTATTWSTPPIRLLEWIWPRVFGDPMLGDQHLYFGYPGIERAVPLILSIYCGALVIALAVGAAFDRKTPRRRALTAMMALGIFLALGRFNPIYSILLVKIPPFSAIRFPEKFLLLTTTAIILAAALHWQTLLRRRETADHLDIRVPQIVAVVALVLSAALYLAPVVAPDLTLQLLEGSSAERIRWSDEPSALTQLPDNVLTTRAGYLGWETFVSSVFWLAALTVVFLHSKRRIPHGLLTTLVLALLILELGYYGRTVNSTVPADLLLEAPDSLRDLPPSAGRVFSDTLVLPNEVLILPDPDSELPSELRRFLERLDPYIANLWGYGYALNPDADLMQTRQAAMALEAFLAHSGLLSEGWQEKVYRFLGAWNVGIVVRGRSPAVQIAEYERTGRFPSPARILHNPEVLDLYRAVPEVIFAPDRRAAIEQVEDRQFALTKFDAVIDSAAKTPGRRVSFDSKVKILKIDDRGSHVAIEYQSQSPGFMVIAITADRDWSAAVDDIDTILYTTALGQMGLEMPAGDHRLLLSHRNPAVTWGSLISLVSLLGCTLVLRPRRMSNVD